MIKRPNYDIVNLKRIERFKLLHDSVGMQASAKMYYQTRPVEFINDWGITYDPRNASKRLPTLMPFVLFNRQKELIDFFYQCLLDQECGAVEKSRDYGATWSAVWFAIWCYIFLPGSAVGFGSRKETLIDRIGDPSSIFEKIRMGIRNLPSFFQSTGYNEKSHATYMKVVSPENGSTITGEAGDNIGRGGRTTIYFKDESAFYEHPEKIEAALGDNTDVQIDISTVNGPSTIFQRRIDSGEYWKKGKEISRGVTRVFILDWHDHPLKDQEWYDNRKAKAEREGLSYIFAMEVDRDAEASVEGRLIKKEWIQSAINAHKKLNFTLNGDTFSGLDVSDEGDDLHAQAIRKGVLLKLCEDWVDGDPGDAAKKALFNCKNNNVRNFQYDSIGVGVGVKVQINNIKESGLLPKNLKVLPWAASAKVLLPEQHVILNDLASPKNKDYYENLKAQGWWQLRIRLEKTHRAITKGIKYPEDELISIDPDGISDIYKLTKELCQVIYTTNNSGKIVIDKQPKGTKSPNQADAVVICYWPITTREMII